MEKTSDTAIREARNPAGRGPLGPRLFAEVVREFHTPLALILGTVRDLEAGIHGDLPPGIADPIELMRRTAERLAALAERILDNAGLDAEGPEIRLRHEDLHAPGLPLAPGVRPTGADLRWLERVRGAIETGAAEETFSVRVLADRLAVHRSRLHEKLRHLTGLPPVRLILLWRLERAAALLENGAASVSQAAYAAGFQNVEHFSRSFRKHYGQAPSAYRRGEARLAARPYGQ